MGSDRDRSGSTGYTEVRRDKRLTIGRIWVRSGSNNTSREFPTTLKVAASVVILGWARPNGMNAEFLTSLLLHSSERQGRARLKADGAEPLAMI